MKILIILSLWVISFSHGFENNIPLVTDFAFTDDSVGIVLLNDNAGKKGTPIFYKLSKKAKKIEKIDRDSFNKNFNYPDSEIRIFDDNYLAFDERSNVLKAGNKSQVEVKLQNCKSIDDWNSACEFMELKYDGGRETISLKEAKNKYPRISAIDFVGGKIIFGAAYIGDAGIGTDYIYSYDPKNAKLTLLTEFEKSFFASIKHDKRSNTIWVGTDKGAFQLDSHFKIIQSCPIKALKGKKTEVIIMCQTTI